MNPRTLFVANALVSLIAVAGTLLLYDRQVIRPARTIGVVDLAEVYRVKEDEFTRRLTSARTEEERQAALDMARAFSRQLPAALAALPAECGCLVVLKASVAGPTPYTVDLTEHLRRMVETP
ncbi:hypothetical protein E6C76_12985 [Pseudothauera nasutitermitis]|uniref:Uncharacterized protein n=1 Tax=Pseudothauera nasutitermitis TaxID=2565930 RepID=A0A4S4B206_9RHOO|nr:hypothetical protein [Pseudothauera nasutitermitis]THF64938.1 hypothetical protein E6C76_12985 [Pseudothauera nasutitermitis]